MTTILAQSVTTIEFDATLRHLAQRATTTYAGEHRRIDRGLLLALNGHVTLHADGTAHVRSEYNPEVLYRIAHGRCECPDGALHAPDGRCKHVWARCLVKKARRVLYSWYADYVSDERATLNGIAEYTPQGWIFTPEGGMPLHDVTLHDLCLRGHKATADAQQIMDRISAVHAKI